MFFATCHLVAQDTLTVLQYNLLHYGNFTSYCTTANNNIDDKDGYIRTIIDYVDPDIFCVNEISKSHEMHKRLLDNDLNVDGITHYKMSGSINMANSYIVNMLYYNSVKLELHSHTVAQSYVRDIDVYRLYYKSDDLPDGDTAFVICVVAHLKAGNSSTDKDKRTAMVNNAMDYLDSYGDDNNYLFMGDFNVYKSSEPAYQLLLDHTNPELNFYDPIDTPGNWNNNYSCRFVHTQSTHGSTNGCAASGGMDDRFDFILMSDEIGQGTNHVEYVDGSYTVIGQDGLHFNSSVNDVPTNLSAPADVIEALFGNSDHLPVSLKLSIAKTLGLPKHEHPLFAEISFHNPVAETLEINVRAKTGTDVKVEIMNIPGTIVFSDERKVAVGQNLFNYNIGMLDPGIYFVVFTDGENGKIVKKLVKK